MGEPIGHRSTAHVAGLVLCTAAALAACLLAQAPEAAGPRPAQEGAECGAERSRENILEGTEGDDILRAGGQDAWLFGGGGVDSLQGGAANDALEGGPGDDRLLGGEGDDVLDGGPGADVLRGDDGNDMMDGGDEEDSLNGGPGADDMEGGDADDVLRGEGGDDIIAGGDGDDILIGGDGVDKLFGRDGNDKLSGGPDSDMLEGGDGTDQLEGGDGDDQLKGGESQDVIRGEAGNDALDGGLGGDLLNGGPGNDSALGRGGDDFIDGGDGHDTLIGGAGDDVISGGQGYDWFLGGLGADVIRAGSEDDLVVLRAGDIDVGGNELIDGGTGEDTLILNGFTRPVLTGTSALPEGRLFLTDPYTGGAYFVSGVERIRYSQVFTQLSDAGSSNASFVIVNPSVTTASTADISFFDQEGTPQPLAAGQNAPNPRYSLQIPALGLAALVAVGVNPSLQGSAFALSELPLAVSAADGGASEALLGDHFIVPVVELDGAGIHTGIVLFSNTVPSTVTLTLRRPNGEEVSTESHGDVEVEIPAHGRRTLLIAEVFRELLQGHDFQGNLTIEGGTDRPQVGGSLAVTGMMQSVGGSPSVFPAIQLAPAPREPILHFAALTAGQGADSSIVLVNTSYENARGVVSFFDDAGEPWAVAESEDEETAATTTFDIAPLGSAVIELAETGLRSTGMARAEIVSGTIGALLRTGLGISTLGTSRVFEDFIAPVRRDAAAGANTRVGLASTRSALNLTLVLRNAGGIEIPGGRVQLQLPANGCVAHTIDEFFPAADTSNFQGTLAVTAAGSTVAAEVVHVGASGRLVGVPTVALQP